MFIIYGSRTMYGSVASGAFICPRCSRQTNYDHQSGRLWFTLYFIPVIPLWSNDSYVECKSCRGTFDAEVLSPEMQQHFMQQASAPEENSSAGNIGFDASQELYKGILLTLANNRAFSAEEFGRAEAVCQAFKINGITADTIRQHVQSAAASGESAAAHAQQELAFLDNARREQYLAGLLYILAGEAAPAFERATFLQNVGQHLGIAPQQMQAILQRAA